MIENDRNDILQPVYEWTRPADFWQIGENALFLLPPIRKQNFSMLKFFTPFYWEQNNYLVPQTLDL